METKKGEFKKKSGKIIIVEGLWNTGKTTLCRYLQKYHNFYFLQEPNHIKAGLIGNNRKAITKWYFEEHFKDLKQGLNMMYKGSNVVIERSPIASIAFAKAYFKEEFFLNNEIIYLQKLLKKYYDKKPYLIFLKHPNIKLLSYYLSKSKERAIYSNPEFLEKLYRCLLFFIQLLHKENLIDLIIIKSNKFLVKKLSEYHFNTF